MTPAFHASCEPTPRLHIASGSLRLVLGPPGEQVTEADVHAAEDLVRATQEYRDHCWRRHTARAVFRDWPAANG